MSWNKVTFTYFESKALGESGRLLLAYGGQEFEDKRFNAETWPKIKPTTPFGQTPMLEIDGKKYAQSLAIARFLGRKYGLAGATPEEDFEIDMYNYFVDDIRAKAASVQYESDEVVKEKKHEDFSKNAYPAMLSKLNEIVEQNNGHIAVGKLTWADFVFAGMYDYLKMMMRIPDLDTKYPNLKKVVDNVYSLPQLKAYLAAAPKRAH
ncbi:glutathione S-transferase 2-like [Ostrinia nubilalis]|uniref:glutathione S-transferase 2-like n=1 Tax=Ostrinia nubilalis TaxID=29057 RepID=UPI0030823730